MFIGIVSIANYCESSPSSVYECRSALSGGLFLELCTDTTQRSKQAQADLAGDGPL